MTTVPCTRCGLAEVPAPKSIEEDPICLACRHAKLPQIETLGGDLVYEFNNDEGGCPGWNDSCGNMLEGDADLCPDCTMARLDAQSPRIGTDTRRPSGEALLGFDGENTYGGGYYC